jgi:hypothetical protein
VGSHAEKILDSRAVAAVRAFVGVGRVSPDQYAEAVLHTHPAYPWGGLSAIAITAVEALVLYAIIRPKTYLRSWKRSAAALLLFFPELLVCAVLLMHQPGYVFAHFLWVLAVNLVLGAM